MKVEVVLDARGTKSSEARNYKNGGDEKKGEIAGLSGRRVPEKIKPLTGQKPQNSLQPHPPTPLTRSHHPPALTFPACPPYVAYNVEHQKL